MQAGTLVRDETITLDGIRLHYRDWGDPAAPPVVLLHAYLQHARIWDTLARGLADRFRVLALDQRGHGESGWAADYHELRLVGDLAGFVDALALDRFAVVGFSIGGAAAGSYAALYPERVDRAVLLECFTAGNDAGDEPWLQEMRAHLVTLRSLPASVGDPSEAAAAFRPLAPHAQDDDLQRWIRDGMVKGKDGRWSWRYDPGFREPGPENRLVAPMPAFRHRLGSVTCPVLVVVGADSWMVEPTAQAATLLHDARALPLCPVQGTGFRWTTPVGSWMRCVRFSPRRPDGDVQTPRPVQEDSIDARGYYLALDGHTHVVRHGEPNWYSTIVRRRSCRPVCARRAARGPAPSWVVRRPVEQDAGSLIQRQMQGINQFVGVCCCHDFNDAH